MRKRPPKSYDDDDGRVISSMENVDGMSWNSEKLFGRKEQKESQQARPEDDLQLTLKEKWAMARGVFAAALLIAGVYVLAALVFILFCIFIWLK